MKGDRFIPQDLLEKAMLPSFDDTEAFNKALDDMRPFDGSIIITSTLQNMEGLRDLLISKGFREPEIKIISHDEMHQLDESDQFAMCVAQEKAKKVGIASLYGSAIHQNIETLLIEPTPTDAFTDYHLHRRQRSKRKRSRTFHRKFIGS